MGETSLLLEVSERSKLRRELSRLDTVFFLISAMVVVDTIGAIAIGGPQAFTWLIVLFAFFFVPSALATAEMGAALPDEGGPYVWVRQAFGRFAGALTSLLYWAGTPMWLGGSLTVVAIAVWERFVSGLGGGASYAFVIAFVALATVGSIAPLRWGKWVPSSGAIGQIVLLAFFTATLGLYGARHGVHRLAVGDLEPSYLVFIAVVPVLLYSFVGIELPSTAGEEMVDPRRDIPAAIARAGVGQLLMYAVPILAVLVVLPPQRVTSLHGLVDAMQTVFTVYGGEVAADGTATLTGAGAVVGVAAGLMFLWVLIASGTTWIMGASRAQAAACLDGAGPPALGRISARTGVPVRMALLSGALSLLTGIVDLGATRGDTQRYFSASLTVAVSLILLAYLMVFPAFLALRLRRPSLERPFRVPGGTAVAAVVAFLATAWCLLGVVCLLWPGFGTPRPDDALPGGFEGDRLGFELLVLGPLVGLLLLCAVFYALGTPRGPDASPLAENGDRHPGWPGP
jgi:glutamate:GABA antiporter